VHPPILEIDGLSKQFQLHDQNALIPSCARVDLAVHAGELTALVGPTGAGKSSVLKAIYRTYLPSSGRILYRDANGAITDLALASEHRMLELRRQDLGFVTQFLHCLPRKSAMEVVAEPLAMRGTSRELAAERACELLDLLNVPERLWRVPPATFSGGEKQRVNLARGLIARPRLLLPDEPTASLDPATTDRVVDLLNAIKAEGVGMLAIFHDPQLVERLADRVVTLSSPVAASALLEETTP